MSFASNLQTQQTKQPARRIVVVGGVAGGATAAARLRRMDEACIITVFEKGPYVSFANCGLPYFIGDVINSKPALLLADPALFRDRFNIDVRIQHEVLSIDRANKSIMVTDLAANKTFSVPYDYLILSPGAAPIFPSLPGVDLPGVFTLRTIPDSENIKSYIAQHDAKRAAIIGGGFIGVEMAENFAHLKMVVTVVERNPQFLTAFDPEMVQTLPKYLSGFGIQFLPNKTVLGFEKTATGIKVLMSDASANLEADIIILAIGVRPESQLAKACGLEIGEFGGVRTDETMRTSDPFIYAVGDSVETKNFITGKYNIIPLAGPANRQGRVAADAICGLPSKYRGIQGTAVCQAFDMVMACTGQGEKSLIKANIPYEKVYLYPKQHVGYYPGAETISMKLLFDPKSGKILGAQAIGKSGAEKRIDVISTAIQGGLTVHDLEEIELCYAPQVGAAKDPVNLTGMIASNAIRGDAPVKHWSQGVAKLGSNDILLDVRSRSEFENGHVDNAIHIPLPELRSRYAELSSNKRILVYCGVGQRGYYATRLLKQLGFDAHNISGGITSFNAQKL